MRVGCLILVVQHGEKEPLPGDPGLTAAGRAQAQATAEWLRSTHTVTRVATSPLRRARETAGPIASMFGVDVATDHRLRERMNWEGDEEQSLETFLSEWHRTSTDRSFVPQGGDSSHQAADRFLAALDDLAGATDDGEAVAVAHGGVTVDALRTVLGDAELVAQQPTLIEDGVPHCAITAFRRTDRGWTAHPPSTQHLDRIDPPPRRA